LIDTRAAEFNHVQTLTQEGIGGRTRDEKNGSIPIEHRCPGASAADHIEGNDAATGASKPADAGTDAEAASCMHYAIAAGSATLLPCARESQRLLWGQTGHRKISRSEANIDINKQIMGEGASELCTRRVRPSLSRERGY
jgi:hypothetical protein